MNTLIQFAKNLFKKSPFYSYYCDEWRYRKWVQDGKPVGPPPVVKQRAVREYGRKFRLRILVETGTYLGDMVHAVKRNFRKIYSIELGKELFEQARIRFSGDSHIILIQGDSGVVLKDLMKQIDAPCLFWLDGHYSAGVTAKGELFTPIRAELETIFNHPLARKHVILIDDAGDFTGKNDYPDLREIETRSKAAGFDHFAVIDDIVRIYNA